MRNISPINLEALLAEDGSPLYVPHLIDGEVLPPDHVPVLIAVMTTSAEAPVLVARRRHDGIDVLEHTANLSEVGIVACIVVSETQWKCPKCGTSWRKLGVHTGQLKCCSKCDARFFLRRD